MKYLLLKNKIEIRNNILKFYMLQIALLFIYLMINKSSIPYFGLKEYSSVLGLETIEDSYVVYILMKIMNYLIIIHLIMKVFIDSMLKTIQYVMLRLNSKKWILYEILNFIFYVILLRFMFNLLLYFSFKICGSNIDFGNFILLMIKDILFFLILLLLIILVLNLFSLKKSSKWFIFLPILLIVLSLNVCVSKISFAILIIGFIVLFIFDILIFKPSSFYTQYCNK